MDRREIIGAVLLGNGQCRFRLWAPDVKRVEVHLIGKDDRYVPLVKDAHGYHEILVDHIKAGQLYRFRLNGDEERPDPASRHQPQGVHGPSQVEASEFAWTDSAWKGIALDDYILYELHVGTFSPEGTFEGVIPHLDSLKDLGITAIELMPVAQFPGTRNWGYDGVFPFAPQNSYGGPEGLRELVDACHARGLAVVMDVVYNHLGPEGNYLWGLGPYFADKYHTPWGKAVNVDDAGSLEVRRFFIKNALYWIVEFHIDALRLDAIHAIYDFSAQPFLKELGDAVHHRATALGREILVIAESDLNDARVVTPWDKGGYGLDAAWSDDFHHALHTLLTGEKSGYYRDFGPFEDLVKAVTEGFVYDGRYSEFRRRTHGNSAKLIPPQRLVISLQNHDQVGNRMKGERLSQLISFEKQKLAAGLLLLSPYTPLLFMGEEYGETAPFLYFMDHSDTTLIEAVRKGRRAEFASFHAGGEPSDPKAESTFRASTLDFSLRLKGNHHVLWMLYRELIKQRKNMAALRSGPKDVRHVSTLGKVLFIHQSKGPQQVFLAFNFGDKPAFLEASFPLGRWEQLLNSADPRWSPEDSSNGSKDKELPSATLAPFSFSLFTLR